MDRDQKSYLITETPMAGIAGSAVISFLAMMMSPTIAKRVAALVLLALDIPDECIAVQTGLGQRPVRGNGKQPFRGNRE